MTETLPVMNRHHSPRKVLIIGAGISGLVLAQGLQKNGIPCSVFERDVTKEYRAQGYRIKIPPDVAADLRSTLSEERWQEFEQTCAETVPRESLVNAINGNVMSRRGRLPMGLKINIYTVDRATFRSVLLKGLEEIVHFGREFTNYELKDNGVIAHFADGSTSEGAILVGAHGGKSKVRAQYLPEYTPVDTQSSCIYGKTLLTPKLMSRLKPGILGGFTWCMDYTPLNQSIIFGDTPVAFILEDIRFPHREARPDLPPDYLYWVLTFRNQVLAATDKQLRALFQGSAKELSLDMSTEWDPEIRCVLELQDEAQTLCTKMYSADPAMPAWKTNPRITLVGDSIHPMSTNGGVGAVAAVKNAATVVRNFVENGLVESSIAAYEESLREFARISLARTFQAGGIVINQPSFESCKAAAV
jgi:2-polyprenyl-6-methoxyphenol hydroxylase-like FAD-dependent oxidoreductase